MRSSTMTKYDTDRPGWFKRGLVDEGDPDA
jgi:hypothetical protein